MVQISCDLYRTFDLVACLNHAVVPIVIVYKCACIISILKVIKIGTSTWFKLAISYTEHLF